MTATTSVLRGAPGDRLVIRGRHVAEIQPDAEILEVLGEDGGSSFLVRWDDTGHVSRFYPGSGAYIQHVEHERPRPPRAA
jgi:hypothetical protein